MPADALRPYRGPWDRAAATHVLRRAGFGAGRARVERALEEGFGATVDAVLATDEHDPALYGGARHLLAAGNTDQLAAWWMALILDDRAPLRERMTLMWHDHFATSDDKVDDVRLMYGQLSLLREHALGDFRALLHGIARDPAMLVWLDGNENRRGHPNENFAREVLELFGLGIGNYAEADVLEAARAFTGWGTRGRSFLVREADHDPGTKRIFGQTGAFRGEDVIDLILAHPACPRHVARRLLEEFVVAEPEEAWIAETATLLVDNDWDLGRTVEVLLRSELFLGPEARRSRIAGPVELVASTLLALGARVPASDAAEAVREMGQALLRPPTVKGWDGGRVWINAGTWLARHNHLAAFGRDGDDLDWDPVAAFGDPAGRDAVVPAVLELLLPDVRDPAYREVLDTAAISAPSVDDALRRVVALVLTSPEYHLI